MAIDNPLASHGCASLGSYALRALCPISELFELIRLAGTSRLIAV